MSPIKARTLACLTGLLFVIALAGFCFNRAGAVTLPVDAISITLRAPDFESAPGGGLQLVQPDAAAGAELTARQPLYSTDVEQGQPVLPHQLVSLVLPPDADLDSLALELEDAQVGLAPGRFEVPLAEPKVLGCAPVEAPGTCSAAGSERPFIQPSIPGAISQMPLVSAGLSLPLTSPVPGQPAGRMPWVSQGPSLQLASPLPDQPVTLMPYGQLRKWKLAHLDYQPFRYDPGTGQLTVTRQVTARLTFRRDPALLDRILLSDTVMDDRLPETADNYLEAKGWYEQALSSLGGPIQSSVTNDYLVITTDAIYDNSDLGIYMQYLREHGHSVSAFTTSRYGGKTGAALADAIRSELKNIYASWGLTYVLLVGDPTPDGSGVPMRLMYPDRLTNLNPTDDNPKQQVPTDLYYADLTGNWDLNGNGFPGERANPTMGWAGDFDSGGVNFAPTLYVGRIPVYNNDYAALDSILQKLMDYQNATGRPTWRNNALLANSFWGNEYDGAVLGHLVDENLLDPRGLGAYRIYSNYPKPASGTCIYNQISGYDHDADLGNQVVQNQWANNPAGLMVWSGHGNVSVTVSGFGSATIDCWREDLFNSNQAAALNDTRPAFTYQNSCLNGHPESSSNLGYSLLSNGAVSTVSASRVTWLDKSGETETNLPSTFTSAANKGYQYVNRLMQGYTAGAALAWADSLWPVTPTTNAQNNFDFNLYGDPAMVFYVPTTSPPLPPSQLTGQLVTTDEPMSFKLDWQDNSNNETYFRITLSPTDNSTDTIVNLERNRITTRVPVPACGKSYDITIRSAYSVTVSDPSNQITLAAQPCPPAAPESLNGFIWNHSINLSWDDVESELGYYIMRRTVIGNMMTMPFKVGTVGPNVSIYADTSALCYHTYIYTIVAFNLGGNSAPSPALTINSPKCPPPAPSNLVAGALAQTGLTLTWTDNSNGADNSEAGFAVYRQPPGGDWIQLAALAPNTTNFSVNGLQCGDANSGYKVKAYNNGGTSESPVIQAKPAACTIPNAPTDLAVEDEDLYPGSVQLGWTDNSNNEWGFKIEKQNGSLWELVATVGVDQVDQQISGLSCSAKHSFRIHAYNGAGASGFSGPIDASTAACDPNVPENFQGSGGTDGITLSWTWHGAALVNFEIQRASIMLRRFSWSKIATLPGSQRDYLDTNVSCGNHYYYRIRSVQVTGFASAYTPAMLVQNVPCPPGAPGAISAQADSSSSIRVTWRPPLVGGVVDGYNIYHGVPGRLILWSKIGTSAADELTFTDTHLGCGTSFYYRVSAFNLGGEGAFSGEVLAGTLICPPAAPTGLTRTEAGLTGLALAWTDNSSNEDGFILQRLDPLEGWTDAATTAAGVNSATDSGLNCGTLYRYRALAYNAGGESAPSPELQTGTRLCQPALTAQAGVQGLVTLTWRDLTTFPVEHLVERQLVPGGPWNPIGSAEPGINTFRDLTAPCGQTLYYRAAGTSAISDGPWSSPASTASICAPTTEMTLETGPSTAHSISLTWRASAGGQTGFVLERSADGTFFWEVIAKPAAGDNAFVDTGLEAGRRFYYRLTAVNLGGQLTSRVATGETKFESLIPLIRR